jgi:hypothetical protein
MPQTLLVPLGLDWLSAVGVSAASSSAAGSMRLRSMATVVGHRTRQFDPEATDGRGTRGCGTQPNAAGALEPVYRA